MARTVKHRKNVQTRIEAEIIGRATSEECEQAATLAYAQADMARSNTSKAAFDLLAALANAQATRVREREAESSDIVEFPPDEADATDDIVM